MKEIVLDSRLLHARLWTTRDGRQIHLKDMEDGHLTNTWNLLERRIQAPRLHLLGHACPFDFPCDVCEKDAERVNLIIAWQKAIDDEQNERARRVNVEHLVMLANKKNLALCQCVRCEKYVARNRAADGSDPQTCVECRGSEEGLPLAQIRGTLTDTLSLELLSLVAEECAEVIQRKEKIVRWGWDADFEGTTQQHKLESELGDQLAATILLAWHEKIDLQKVILAAEAKLEKFRKDAAGPRQRLLHADVPPWSVEEFLKEAIYPPY